MLKLENLTKTFHGKKVIDSVSVNVGTGEIAVFLGPSGVGKSTLLRLLNNLETLDTGRVVLNGEELDLTAVNKTHTIGMVFQQFNLFEHITVEQNIILSLEKTMGKSKKEAHAIAHELLKRYELEDKAHQYVSQLSGGQKQRLALTRTMALKPKIICLDEPTSALDPLLTSHVAKTIQQLAREGYIVLIATHDTALLEKLDCTIYLMSEGKIIESAISTDFRKEPDEYPHIKRFVAGHNG